LENFLYDFKDSDHLKLIDFGFSKVWDPNVKMRVSCGTLSYVAPEVLKQSYTSKCDLWSLGVITFILLAGYMPFSGSEKSQTQNIQGGLYSWKPERWSKVSPEAIEFVKSLLKVSVDQRLSAQQALEHQWIAKRKQKKSAAIDDSVVDALRNFGKASKFRRCCLEMMAWSLSNEERAKVRQYFIQMDKNHQGTITLAELKEVLTEKFHIADEESNAIFAAMDTNNDEEIHYSDFLAAMVSTRIALHDDLLLRAFKRFDVDNSGYITADNLREVLGDSFEGEEIEKLIKEADALNDGRISYQEFVSYLRGEPLDTHKLAAEKFLDNQIKAQDSEREKKMRLRGSQENAVKKQPERGDPAKQVCCCVS
jgi:Ca2+-binding EF-hand superfamily protein